MSLQGSLHSDPGQHNSPTTSWLEPHGDDVSLQWDRLVGLYSLRGYMRSAAWIGLLLVLCLRLQVTVQIIYDSDSIAPVSSCVTKRQEGLRLGIWIVQQYFVARSFWSTSATLAVMEAEWAEAADKQKALSHVRYPAFLQLCTL
eukprot:TRINITY_DN37756_c0_g1_i1.p1 TRINITY_DN37756_c0_g1~~TRINITY_DN37756_c0_g1_i1.p1  ORF type:complete len:144 (+),score=3.45 TRINITY_DN37756_c0_g1_i1:164-595(+)